MNCSRILMDFKSQSKNEELIELRHKWNAKKIIPEAKSKLWGDLYFFKLCNGETHKNLIREMEERLKKANERKWMKQNSKKFHREYIGNGQHKK